MAGDWITAFMSATEGIRSQPQFRLWTAIGTLASVMERRVYCYTDGGMTYANLYTVLCGPPGSGKTQAIRWARNLLIKVPELHLAPDNVTKPAFFDRLQIAIRTYMNGLSSLSIVSALAVVADELGVFIPRYDMEFLADLSKMYDNPPIYDMPRRTTVSVKVENPTVNILAGIQPDFLGELIPEAAWGQGFMARIFFVYGPALEKKERNIFAKQSSAANIDPLIPGLLSLAECSGEMFWTEPARMEINKWYNTGMLPVPTHSRLIHYNERRDIHAVKLSMISALSAGHFPEVKTSDFERAHFWMATAEETMPDIFRAMAQKSDIQLIEDLHHRIYSEYSSLLESKRKPIVRERLTFMLRDRVPSERVEKIIDNAISAGYFAQAPMQPGRLIPRPLSEVYRGPQ